MKALEKIINCLKNSRYEGVLQSELSSKLNLSKSTVSEILSFLEKRGVVVREIEAGKSFRLWLSEYYPKPRRGILKLGILKASEYACILDVFDGIVRVYDNTIDLTRDLTLGRVDLGASPFITQLMFGIMMKNIKVIRLVAMNGSGIVFGDRKNGVFGTSEMSVMEINLKAVRDRFNIRRFEYFSSPESMIDSLPLLEGIAIWEPYISSMDKKKIYFNEILGDHPCCSLAVNVESFKVNKELIKEFISMLDNAKPNIKRVSEVLGFDEGVIRKSVESYKFNTEIEVETLKNYLKLAGIDISVESMLSVVNPEYV